MGQGAALDVSLRATLSLILITTSFAGAESKCSSLFFSKLEIYANLRIMKFDLGKVTFFENWNRFTKWKVNCVQESCPLFLKYRTRGSSISRKYSHFASLLPRSVRPPTRFFQNRDFVPNMQNNNNNNKSLVPKINFPDRQSNRGTIRRTVGIRKDHLRDSFAIPAQQGRPFSTTKTPTLSSPPTGTRRTMAALTCWPSPWLRWLTPRCKSLASQSTQLLLTIHPSIILNGIRTCQPHQWLTNTVNSFSSCHVSIAAL